MTERETSDTLTAPSHYPVRHRHGSWASSTLNRRPAPRLRVRALSQQHSNPSQTDAFIETPIDNFESGDLVNAAKPSTTGWNLEVPPRKYQYEVSRSPKSSEKTVAQLRQRFEQRSSRDEGDADNLEGQHRGHRRSKSVRSALVLVNCREVEHQASVDEVTSERAYIRVYCRLHLSIGAGRQTSALQRSGGLQQKDDNERILV
ncbi:uncharacterized protein M421DRAFT_422358 [Didymella exigua CBS 183.55]|uniref:Uncharacterized protein n=1 Tax=Didymella exigua CBS 183.55 TaxID=1150837 RepID=A0A6A5RGV2_9PLEO|nr:uncharacterized protein M421DRAFT_422358 [Didymella exigua CBS 183.55]KAF1926759.1 hypothetical protein M421DRAFT_422358 [Didymella exigua CBS 183.55]